MLSPLKSPPKSWSEQAFQRFRDLTDRPVFLVCILLAANALTRPYANIVHDTRLYSAQVLNQVENGSYNGDLFFRYGSQDQYSLFSVMLAPLVKMLGLESAFFLVYLCCNTLFIAGLVRLMGRLVEDPFLRIVSLVYLVVGPLNYGGHYTFHVHEPFLTPRLPAAALVLFGLAELLRRAEARVPSEGAHRPLTQFGSPVELRSQLVSLGLMIAAALLHPLIATGGFLIWAGVVAVDWLGWRWATALGSGVAAAAVVVLLATPAVALKYLGEMDETWRDVVLKSSGYNFTGEWLFQDWCNVILSLVSVIAGAYILRERFLAVAGLVGIAAVVGTVMAENLPYALLLQGQPYRSLWILKVLQIPLCLLFVDRLLRSPNLAVQLLGFVPLGFLLSSGPYAAWDVEWTMPLYFFPVVVLAQRGLEPRPRRPDWLVRSVGWSLLLGELTWCVYREAIYLSGWNVFLQHQELFELCRALLLQIGVLPWMLIVLGSMLWLAGRFPGSSNWTADIERSGEEFLAAPPRRMPRFAPALSLSVFLLAQSFFFVMPNTPFVRSGSRNLTDIVFAREYLEQHAPSSKKLTVYSSYGRLELVWLELKTDSYFDWLQTVGCMFRRQTALEGQRRALVVGPFELERFREIEAFLDVRHKKNLKEFYQHDLDSPGPTVADLARLCAEPDLDYIIVKHEFPGLYAATNGRVYVYDCQQVRARLAKRASEGNVSCPSGS